jgi:ribosome-binding protein aMBF1 (putative translation factor)
VTVGTRFEDFVRDVEGSVAPQDRAELEAFRAHHRFAAQFRTRRLELELTQVELAERMGVDQAEVSRLERAAGNPTQQTLLRAADALGMSLALVPQDSEGAPGATLRASA